MRQRTPPRLEEEIVRRFQQDSKFTLRKCTAWLNNKGVTLSHVTIKRILERHDFLNGGLGYWAQHPCPKSREKETRQILEAVLSSLRQSKEPVIITGSVGSGKTSIALSLIGPLRQFATVVYFGDVYTRGLSPQHYLQRLATSVRGRRRAKYPYPEFIRKRIMVMGVPPVIIFDDADCIPTRTIGKIESIHKNKMKLAPEYKPVFVCFGIERKAMVKRFLKCRTIYLKPYSARQIAQIAREWADKNNLDVSWSAVRECARICVEKYRSDVRQVHHLLEVDGLKGTRITATGIRKIERSYRRPTAMKTLKAWTTKHTRVVLRTLMMEAALQDSERRYQSYAAMCHRCNETPVSKRGFFNIARNLRQGGVLDYVLRRPVSSMRAMDALDRLESRNNA